MGSGCTSTTGNKDNCLNPISDKCVKYTGDPIPLLGICTGDWLDEVTDSIVTKLLSLLDGTGITPLALTANCQYAIDLLQGKDKDMSSLIQILFDSQCTLKDAIDSLKTQSEQDHTFSFDLKCLPSSPTIDTKDKLLQALINISCTQQSQVDDLTQKVNENSTSSSVVTKISNTITSCNDGVKVTGSGEDTKVNIVGIVPIRGCVFGDFDMSNFDSTGKGICEKGTGNFAIANGLNGTINLMNRVAAMANTGINGVFELGGPGNHPVGTTVGSDTEKLTVSEIPSHSHPLTLEVNEEPHSHSILFKTAGFKPNSGGDGVLDNNPPYSGSINYRMPTDPAKSNVSVTGSVGQTGGNQSHNNIQPTYYGVWIQRIS